MITLLGPSVYAERIEKETKKMAAMNEHVGAAGVGLNEPEAFRRIEPFHCARRHGALLSNRPTNLERYPNGLNRLGNSRIS